MIGCKSVLLWSLRESDKGGWPRRTRRDVVDKDVNDLCFKPSDAVDRSKRKTIKLATAHRSRISIRGQTCKIFLTCSLITAAKFCSYNMCKRVGGP